MTRFLIRLAICLSMRIAIRALGFAARIVVETEMGLARRSAVPVVRCSRRRGAWCLSPQLRSLFRSLSLLAPPELREWIALPDQTGKFRKRIARLRLGCTPMRVVGAIRS